MSEPKYAGTKRKNNSQYTSYLANYLAAGKDGGERLTLVLNRVILSELIDLACPTAEHLKFLTHAKLKLSLSLLRVNAFAMIKQA